MPKPQSQLVTSRPDLATVESFDLLAQNYVGLQIFPAMTSDIATGNFNQVELSQLLAATDEDLVRAAGSGWSRDDWKFKPRSFATVMRGKESPLDLDEAEIFGDILDAEQICVQRAYEALYSEMDRRIVAAAFGATVTAGRTTAASKAWSDSAGALPVDDVIAAGNVVRNRTGLYPNAVVMSRPTWRKLIRTAQIIAQLGGGTGSNSNVGRISQEQVAELFDDCRVIVAGGVKLSGSGVASIVPDNQVLVCRVAEQSNNLREPCIGRTIVYKGLGAEPVEEYEDPTISSMVYRAKMRSCELVMIEDLAQVITGV